MVVQVFIAEREGEHALADQGLDRVLEQSWVAPVGETAGHPTDQPEAAIQPPQQQPSGIRCDDSAIEPGHNLVPFNRFKFEQCWATLCLHRGLSGIAVSDWRIAIFRDSPPRCIKGFEKSGLGFMSLAGIIINNGIVLIDRVDTERQSGKDAYDAVVTAAMARARPIVLTTVTTILGLLPLIVWQDPLFYSLAIVIAFGLLIGTVLTLGVVPTLYTLFFRAKIPARAAG